jgi:peptidoglycan hydrolase-like protein with peptidoglycan-binding domain
LKCVGGRSDKRLEHGYGRVVFGRATVNRFRAPFVGCALLAACTVVCAGSSAAKAEFRLPAELPSPTRQVTVFFVKGEQFAPRPRAVAEGRSAATEAVRALLAGPTAAERAAGIQTTLPPRTSLTAVTVRAGTVTVELARPRAAATASDVSLRPARAAQIVYTLTALPGVKQVRIGLNGMDRAVFLGSKLALKSPLDTHDLSRPVALPAQPTRVPKGHAPADPRGVQRRLMTLGYLPANAASGAWDARTKHALFALQGWHGLTRDGVVGPQTLATLENVARPQPTTRLGGRHIEVYRAEGVTLLVNGGNVVRALHSSSGGRGYETPAGWFSVFRKERNSWSVPYQVWLPYASYFNAGIAFHAHADVPAQPASHGCVRLPAADAAVAYSFATIGTRVTVY